MTYFETWLPTDHKNMNLPFKIVKHTFQLYIYQHIIALYVQQQSQTTLALPL